MDPLIVLLHGVGQVPADMAPLADMVAARDPRARVVVPAATDACDRGGAGFQWFSVDGITDDNRADRLHAALPPFIAAIETLQRAHGAAPATTVLAGFSQGAAMALAACEERFLARHVVAIAGRCAPPHAWTHPTAVTFVHGRMDWTVRVQHSERAFERLAALGADVRLDVVPRAVHLLAPPLLERACDAVCAPLS